jgi:hypothetical protein
MPARYQQSLDAILKLPGMLGCALVQQDSGMVVGVAGPARMSAMAEEAVDSWRTHQRREQFREHGPARVLVVIHEKLRLTLSSGGDRLLLVCLSHEPDQVPWESWKREVAQLRQATRDL